MYEHRFYQFPCGCRFQTVETAGETSEDVIPLMEFDSDNVPLDCPATWELLGKGLTKGVFQLESSLGKQWTKKLKPENEEQLAALSAVLRPGALLAYDENGVSSTQHYCRRKNHEEPIDSFHPVIDEILHPTFNVLIYQEQAMAIARAVAKFSLGKADELRKAAAKKDPAAMAAIEKDFIAGVIEAGIITEEQARTLFSLIKASQRYAFCKSHAYPYGLTGYETAYCKAHFPLAFFTSWLDQAKNKQDPKEEICELVNDAKLFDIVVEPPDLRQMNDSFETDRKVIKFGIADIKGIGGAQVAKLKEAVASAENEVGVKLQDWTWYTFLTRCSHRISSGVVAHLIQAGALRWMKVGRQVMLAEATAWNELTDREMAWALTLDDIQRGKVTADSVVSTVAMLSPWEKDPEAWKELTEKKQASAKKKYEKDLEKKTQERQQIVGAIKDLALLPFGNVTNLMKAVAKPKQEGGVATSARSSTILSRVDTLENPKCSMADSPAWIAWVEEDLLGISLSCSKVDSCDVSQVTATCKDYLAGQDGFLIFCVEVKAVREVKTKKGKTPGQKMAFLTISDHSCALEDVVCFPETWKEAQELLTEGNLVLIQGERDYKKDSNTLMVKKVWQAENRS